MFGQDTKRWLIVLLLALPALAGSSTPAAAQPAAAPAPDLLRLTRDVPGDSKMIVLDADEVTTWIEGGQRIVLLKGQVLVRQAVVDARMQQAVAWIDLERFQRTRVLHIDLYAEGAVLLENGPDTQRGERALLELNTRGEFKLSAHKSKVIQQARPEDPLYLRARAVKAPRSVATPPSPIQRTAYEETTPAPQPPKPAPFRSTQTPPGPAVVPPALPAPVPTPPPGPPPIGAVPVPSPPPSAAPPPGLPPTTVTPPPRAAAPPVPAPPPRLAGPAAPARQFSIAPRTSAPFQSQVVPLVTGEQAVIVTGGVILTVRDASDAAIIDIEADRLVYWSRGNSPNILENLRTSDGKSGRESEFYLSGNVEIRRQVGKDSETVRADEIYYDVSRNVAVAIKADLEFKQPGLPDPVHLKAEELDQLSPKQFRAVHAELFSSRLPSDPGLKVVVAEATLEERPVPKTSVFGMQFFNRRTGAAENETQKLFDGTEVLVKVEDTPVFYLPFLRGDANDPLGPLESLSFSQNRVFGFQFMSTFNVYDLLALDPLPGTRWKLFVDYLSYRGPAIGTEFDYAGKDLFDIPSKYTGLVKAYGIYDDGKDILGGDRGTLDNHPLERGRFLWRQNIQNLPEGFTVQSQISALSDKNFLEQYYKLEFDQEINQETFLYVKQQQGNWAWTGLAEARIRNWVTETNWLPRLDGYLIGESLFDALTYNARVDAGYAQLRPANTIPGPYEPTDQHVDTARVDLMQEVSLPFYLGPVKVVPYGVLDLAEYSEDLTGNDRGRFYGGGGVRASMPLSRLYPDVHSLFLNLDGLNHKIVVSSNYFVAHSDTHFDRLPQLDRLNDDATDQALRDIHLRQPALNPKPENGLILATSPLYDPQVYAIRRLVEDRIDTLDTIEVLEFDVRQRLQTKRGYPGQEHIVDWMTLDLSGSYFPQADRGSLWPYPTTPPRPPGAPPIPNAERDNFGDSFAFLEYDYTWNIGDRTALVSTGWYDPIDNGARVFTVGAFLNRPDRTNYYVGYRQIDPVGSQALTGAITYIFSPKYAMTAASTYDFGTKQSLSNSLVLTRMGSDLLLSFGITYNSLLNNFGFTFEILPNLIPQSHRPAGLAALGTSPFGGGGR